MPQNCENSINVNKLILIKEIVLNKVSNIPIFAFISSFLVIKRNFIVKVTHLTINDILLYLRITWSCKWKNYVKSVIRIE
jgi:hypothetical protein